MRGTAFALGATLTLGMLAGVRGTFQADRLSGVKLPGVDIVDMGVTMRAVEKSALPKLVLNRATRAEQYCRLARGRSITENIVHEKVYERADGSLFVQHIDIFQNGARCGRSAGDHLNIYSSDSLASPTAAAAAGLTDTYDALRAEVWAAFTFDKLAQNNVARNVTDPFYVGYDAIARTCGGRAVWPARTFHIFVDTYLRFSDPNLGRIDRNVDGDTETGLAVFKPKGGVCLYKSAVTMGLGPSPTPSGAPHVPVPDAVSEQAANSISQGASQVLPGSSSGLQAPTTRPPTALPAPTTAPPAAPPVAGLPAAIDVFTPINVTLPGAMFTDGQPRVVTASLNQLIATCPGAFNRIAAAQFPGATLGVAKPNRPTKPPASAGATLRPTTEATSTAANPVRPPGAVVVVPPAPAKPAPAKPAPAIGTAPPPQTTVISVINIPLGPPSATGAPPPSSTVGAPPSSATAAPLRPAKPQRPPAATVAAPPSTATAPSLPPARTVGAVTVVDGAIAPQTTGGPPPARDLPIINIPLAPQATTAATSPSSTAAAPLSSATAALPSPTKPVRPSSATVAPTLSTAATKPPPRVTIVALPPPPPPPAASTAVPPPTTGASPSSGATVTSTPPPATAAAAVTVVGGPIAPQTTDAPRPVDPVGGTTATPVVTTPIDGSGGPTATAEPAAEPVTTTEPVTDAIATAEPVSEPIVVNIDVGQGNSSAAFDAALDGAAVPEATDIPSPAASVNGSAGAPVFTPPRPPPTTAAADTAATTVTIPVTAVDGIQSTVAATPETADDFDLGGGNVAATSEPVTADPITNVDLGVGSGEATVPLSGTEASPEASPPASAEAPPPSDADLAAVSATTPDAAKEAQAAQGGSGAVNTLSPTVSAAETGTTQASSAPPPTVPPTGTPGAASGGGDTPFIFNIDV